MAKESRFLIAEGNLSLDEFFDELEKLLTHTWGEDWGVFAEYEGELESPESVSLPRVVYDIAERVPAEKSPTKKRLYGQEQDNDNDRNIFVYRQWFITSIHFYCMASNRRLAREISQGFEQFMDAWVGYFKSMGISEIVFKREFRPEIMTENRQDKAARILEYEIRYENITRIPYEYLRRVNVRINNPKPEKEFTIPDEENS